jgi:hypothetical protein
MNRYTRRHYLQGLLATAAVLTLPDVFCRGVSSLTNTPDSGRWQLGTGANPERFLAEAESDGSVRAVLQAWAPQFLTGWLNSFDHHQADLSYWRLWHQRDLLATWFSRGYSLQVITWEDDQGRPTGAYHISPQFLADLEELAGYIRQANAQGRTTYWSLATEFSFWRLPPDTYNAQTAEYYQALMQNLLKARTIIKAQLPSAWVAPSWGGWIATFDEPGSGAGRSMIPAFAPMLRQMDGVAFQAMRPRATGEYNPDLKGPDPGNPTQILQCCEIFSRYHHSFMVSHYEPSIKIQHPNGGRADTVTHDFLLMMRPSWINAVTRLGLDKLSLMHYSLYKGNPYHALAAAETFQDVLRQGAKAAE